MRILLIAPVHHEKEFFQQKGNYPFLLGQGQMGWVQAMEELGHEVVVIRYSDSILYPNILRVEFDLFVKRNFPLVRNKWQRYKDKFYYLSLENYLKNKNVIKIAEKIKPQIIILSGGAFCIYPSTMKKIKETLHAPLLLFSGVNPTHGSPPAEKKMVANGVIDMIVINDVGFGENWKACGAKKVILLPISAVDRSLYKKMQVTPEERKKYECDVCFIGSLTKERQEILLSLIDYDLKIWGDIPLDTPLNERLKSFYFGAAHGKKMIHIYTCAKIVLNIHASEMKYGGNMRTFEIPATGAFQMIDHVNPEWFVEGKEIVVFRTMKDLKKKIFYYLSHKKEREKIAQAGFKRALTDHTYIARFKKLFTLLQDEKYILLQ